MMNKSELITHAAKKSGQETEGSSPQWWFTPEKITWRRKVRSCVQ